MNTVSIKGVQYPVIKAIRTMPGAPLIPVLAIPMMSEEREKQLAAERRTAP